MQVRGAAQGVECFANGRISIRGTTFEIDLVRCFAAKRHVRTIGHFVYDVVPYWFYGNSSEDATPWGKRVHPNLGKFLELTDHILASFVDTPANP